MTIALKIVRWAIVIALLWWGWFWGRWLTESTHGIDAARGWIMHVSMLGLPFEERSNCGQTVAIIHHTYETLMLLLIGTTLLVVLERGLMVRSLRRSVQ